MYAKVWSGGLQGLEAVIVEVEVDIGRGMPQFHIVGLPDSAIRESLKRVRSALRNSGFDFPMQRITVNLAPADVRKEGASFDLAIAVGILLASGQLHLGDAGPAMMLGELALDGALRGVPGVWTLGEGAAKHGISRAYVPLHNRNEAELIEGLSICTVSHLQEFKRAGELVNFINYLDDELKQRRLSEARKRSLVQIGDYAEVRGHSTVKRAMVIAAAGRFNTLLVGPPGTGKTMMLSRLPHILPPMDWKETLEVSRIDSLHSGRPFELVGCRPYRAPHHAITRSALIGGGSRANPGEITLAHHGVLLLDELPEFSKSALEALRVPLEEKAVQISRMKGTYCYPADFLLAAAMNPCPCGYYGFDQDQDQDQKRCTCTLQQIHRYRARLSGPLLDRIDLRLEVPLPREGEGAAPADCWTSQSMREQVTRAVQFAKARHKQQNLISASNGRAGKGQHWQSCADLEQAAQRLLESCARAQSISYRSIERILNIARTIADLELAPVIGVDHVAEALQFRLLDQGN